MEGIMSNMNQQMDKAEQALLHTYNRFPLVFDHGNGVYLYDTEGKEYLDFAAGIAVSSLGYGDEIYTNALKNQPRHEVVSNFPSKRRRQSKPQA